MSKYLREKVLNKLKKNELITNELFYKVFFKESNGKSIPSFYNFLSECKALDLIEKVDKGLYVIRVVDFGNRIKKRA